MKQVAIIGIGQTPVGEHWDASLRMLAADAVRAALDDVQTAQRNLAIVQTLLAPLQQADPLFAGNQQTSTTQSSSSP